MGTLRAGHAKAAAALALTLGATLLPAGAPAQDMFPFFLGNPGFAAGGRVDRVDAHEPWSRADRDGAAREAITVASTLPDPVRAAAQFRLAQTLEEVGDRPDAATVLRQVAAAPRSAGIALSELARHLVVADEVDLAKTMVADASTESEKRQLIAGMLQGAMQSGHLDLGLDILRTARSLPAERYDPVSTRARELASALAEAKRYRDALSAYPTDASRGSYDDMVLAKLARGACAADPALADVAGHLLAVAALSVAKERPPVETLGAYSACKGEAAARGLVAAMPPDIAAGLTPAAAEPKSLASDDAARVASFAALAAREGDTAKADRLFESAVAALDADVGRRGVSGPRRAAFDKAANWVAKSLWEAHRADAAVAVAARLTALERLPILFNLVRARDTSDDPQPALAAIDRTFQAQPALIAVEVNEIHSLRRVLPPESAAVKQADVWLHQIGVEPPVTAAGAPPGRRARQDPAAVARRRFGDPFFAALKTAVPSVATTERVLATTDTTRAIADAKALKLTPRETAVAELVRDLVRALPAEATAAYTAMVGAPALDDKTDVNGLTIDALLVSVERGALQRHDVKGAHDALAALAPGSPLHGFAAMTLAIGEAKAGLPQQAMGDVKAVTAPLARLEALRAILSVKPTG